MKSPRSMAPALVLLAAAALVAVGVSVCLEAPVVMTEASVRMVEQVEKTAVVPLSELRGAGPVVVAPARWLESVLGAEPALWGLSFGGLLLVAALVFAVLHVLSGTWSALLAPLLFCWCPQTMQLLFQPDGQGMVVFFLVAPALLFGLAGSCSGDAARPADGGAPDSLAAACPGRCGPWMRKIAGPLLAMLGGCVAGGSALAHHFGLWAGLAALLGLAVAGPERRRPGMPGMLSLSPVGIELCLALFGFAVTAAAGMVISGAGKDGMVAWLFGPFGGFHPPLAVAGTVYSEAVDGGPPLWTTAFLLLVRTPVLLVAAALAGVLVLRRRGFRLLSGPLAPLALSWLALFLSSSLAGSPMFLPGVSLLVPLSLFPCLLAAALIQPPVDASQPAAEVSAASLPDSGPTQASVPAGGTRGAVARHWPRLLSGLAAVLLLASVAGAGWRLAPYPAAFGSLVCGGTERCNRASEPWLEVVADSSLVSLVPAGEKELVLVPWGSRAQGVWNRLVQYSGRGGSLKTKDGGRGRVLIWQPASTPAAGLFLKACPPAAQGPVLPPGTNRLWRTCR